MSTVLHYKIDIVLFNKPPFSFNGQLIFSQWATKINNGHKKNKLFAQKANLARKLGLNTGLSFRLHNISINQSWCTGCNC